MTEPTIWQLGHLNVNDETAFPIEFLEPCAKAGYAAVQVLLNPQHPHTSLDQVSVSYLHKIRSTGMKAFGFVWADDFTTALECFEFVRAWREKSLREGCAITGFVINAEDGVEAEDMRTGGQWSNMFLHRFRADELTAKLSLALNTYNGCGGIALPKWAAHGSRFYFQTFHEWFSHAWPIDGYIPWAAKYGLPKPALIRPNWGTYKPYPQRAEQIASATRANTLGFSAWYAEGAGDPAELLIPLLREARAAGVCM